MNHGSWFMFGFVCGILIMVLPFYILDNMRRGDDK